MGKLHHQPCENTALHWFDLANWDLILVQCTTIKSRLYNVHIIIIITIIIVQHLGLWMIVDVETGVTVEMPIERSHPSHPIP